MLTWLLYHLLKQRNPVGPASGTCDPQTPAGHGPVRPHTVTSVRGEAVDIVVITDTTERADIIEALGWLNDTAKHLRRKGYIGTAGQEYARQHARIDALLDELERTP